MRLNLISVGTRMPAWVETAYEEFAGRLPAECRLQLVEVAAAKRSKSSNLARVKQDEGERLLAAAPRGARIIALDAGGESWTTADLVKRLQDWMRDGRDVALLVGGPDGLADGCMARAEVCWSLSALTFPHMLVRIIVAEQIYRAWTVLKGHPYHRA